jgi:NADH:ubiquinone oxidoreductase subunit D
MITEMHQIECDALRRSGVKFDVNETNIYAFRSIAFDKIMTKPDGKLIAHWEDLNQQLAVIEYYLDESEKEIYQIEFREIYLRQCK